MTGATLAAQLVRHGLDDRELPGKIALCDLALAAFRRVTPSAAPVHAWWVPGRLEVFGKHTDYAGGRTLVAALPRGFLFLAAPRADPRIHVVDARRTGGAAVHDAARHGAASTPGWRHYIDVVASRLSRNFPGAGKGATVVFASDLPSASGMSSSSALVVGMAASLVRIWDLTARDEWQAEIRDACDLALYYAAMENGARLGRLAGDQGVGTHGGSEDHAAILLARPAHLSSFSFLPMRYLEDVRLPVDWQIVIATSGVTASKSDAARGTYNHLSRGAAILLELWNASERACPSLAAALATSDTAPDRMRALIRQSAVSGWPPDALERRLAHFEIEDALAAEAVQAVHAADTGALGAISDASQERAALLLGNQVPETIALARVARACGAFAASSFGAGFGGAVWAMVPREDAEAFSARWQEVYRRTSPAGARAVVFLAPPGPAATGLEI